MTPTETLIAALWQKNRPKVLAYVDLLDRAASATLLPAAQQAEAVATAHKLAGSLGMYGFHAATESARQLEQELELPTPSQATLQTLTRSLRQQLESTTEEAQDSQLKAQN